MKPLLKEIFKKAYEIYNGTKDSKPNFIITSPTVWSQIENLKRISNGQRKRKQIQHDWDLRKKRMKIKAIMK